MASVASRIVERWPRGLPVAAAAGVALAACSLLVPLNEQQCNVDADCRARGGPFAGALCVDQVCVSPPAVRDAGPVDAGSASQQVEDAGAWGCLDDPSQVTNANDPVAITFNVFDALSSITTAGFQGGSDFTVLSDYPVSGITIEACDILDPDCLAKNIQTAISDDAGQASFTVPVSFTGFFQLNGPGYLPSKLYAGRLLADASVFAPPVAILATQETTILARSLGVAMQLDPEAGVGHAFFQVYDCFDRHGAGVVFSLGIDAGPDSLQWYTNNRFPSTTATETDTLGAGGAVNIPQGAVTVTATIAATNRTIGSVNAVITAGGATFAWVRARTR